MRRREAIYRYLKRRQLYPFQISTKPSGELRLLVVIPCFDEPDIDSVIASLAGCEAPGCAVEIIVVINGPDGMRDSARANNLRVSEQLKAWESETGNDLPAWLRVFNISNEELPAEQSGVGLARKIGMDEAVARLGQTKQAEGVIICLDADCIVASNYLQQINSAFSTYPECPGMSIHYEHALPEGESGGLMKAITDYELHLRCYVAGQRMARFPYAFHTVGSAMACRASSYAEQGGMNIRQGGEDFYFIQKLVALGGYRALTSTTVFPAVRISNRVPFGTGPAIRKYLETGGELDTYSTEIYRELAIFSARLLEMPPDQFVNEKDALPFVLKKFLEQQRFSERLMEIQSNVASTENFRKRVFRWFNAFRFLKFAQLASREDYPRIPVVHAARQIAELAGVSHVPDSSNNSDWLTIYRNLDRQAGTR